MARMIISKSDISAGVGGHIAGAGKPIPPDSYTDRVAKYIPGEVVALYLVLIGLAAAKPGGPTTTFLLICFAIGLVATPVYLFVKFKKERSKLGLRLKFLQIIVATVAFVLWAWVLQDTHDPKLVIIDPFWGRFLLPIFTFVVGLIDP